MTLPCSIMPSTAHGGSRSCKGFAPRQLSPAGAPHLSFDLPGRTRLVSRFHEYFSQATDDMNPLPAHQTGRADMRGREPSGAVRELLDAMTQGSSIPCRIVFSNGAEYVSGDKPRFTIVFRRRRGE